jgi:hypothetical protein
MPERGCVADHPTEWIQGLFDCVCPVVYLHEYHQVFEAFEWLERDRILPYSGGFLEQPFLIMEYITPIRKVVNG